MDQQFSLSWNNFHGNLSKGFAGLLGKGEFVDVTLAVEGHLLQAHKVILSICSPYFKKMFQTNPCQHPIVVLRDVTLKAMKDLLQFMYHGEVSVKREDLTSFIGTAEVLQIKGLTNKETDDEEEKIKDVSKQNLVHQNSSPDPESCTSENYDNSPNEIPESNEHEVMKQRQFIEKLQRLSHLKRKSEEFLQSAYYSDILNTEKRAKINDKMAYSKVNNLLHNSNYDNFKNVYDETPIDITPTLNTSVHNDNVDKDEECKEQSANQMELKTECDEIDIVVTDPAICTTPKSYEGSRDSKNNSTVALEYQSPQDNTTSLNSLFLDLKNLVNGKVTNAMLRINPNEEFPRPMLEHRLITIPQKEDGKKKYPQRSCRLCWKLGKRRDTRFMCSACELPFCKSPCFEVHFNGVFKVSQLQGDYFAT
ncbi:Modifier of mdg4 [Papilio machaon]|uniref:Modifier of mdg4 n=1 Tax=Papilio machaon TaxID=76193 RepID=A0A194RPX2_PAPMA|nr:Modifier of mdg4 [Papilio machaon]